MKATEGRSTEGRLSIRVKAHQKSVIARAAQIRNVTMTDFVLDTAYRAAQKVVSDESTLTVPHVDWVAFSKALDAPPKPKPALRRLLAAKSPADLDGGIV